jgi:hypothetical protein
MSVGTDLTIVVPIYRRTRNLPRMMESAWRTTPDAEVMLVVCENDLEARLWIDGRLWRDACDFPVDVRVLTVPWPAGSPGDYAKKINAGYAHSDRPLLFTGADDIVFQPGWYEAALGVMQGGAIGVVGTVDDLNGRTIDGTHSTHSLIARWYADQGGTIDQDHVIYHEGYVHEYCDDELVQTAMTRSAYAHAFGAHVTHIHMLGDPALDDEVYRHGRSATPRSRRLYRLRRRLWERRT